ncbi:MAG: hypothetical protein Q4E91_01580 [Lachnospiraceae bacterium]|nr:hypothetical protein [Lachnospiraceae bacterium]
MHDIAILLIGVGVILNSVAVTKLVIYIKKNKRRNTEWFDRWVEQSEQIRKYSEITKVHYETFRNTKNMFLKLRNELIRQQILPKEFQYVDEREAI